jgi:hypothetical protein
MKSRHQKNIRNTPAVHPAIVRYVIFFVVIIAITVLGLGLRRLQADRERPEISTSKKQDAGKGGRIVSGKSESPGTTQISTSNQLVFESREIETENKSTNAVVLKWEQQEGDASEPDQSHNTDDHNSGVKTEMRTKQKGAWSEWLAVGGDDERKDGTPAPHTALILSDQVEKAQFRFKLSGNPDEPSPAINLAETSLEFIDSTKGPSMPQESGLLERILGKLRLTKVAHAESDSPRVYSREEWGSPEANGTPDWDPEYSPLHRVVIHHTVTATDGDSFAAMRAIWHYHRYSNGWGDIGYNYAVDKWGNIFQGRYFDPIEVKRQGGEVVGGHAYGNNNGTVGIAALGTYTDSGPSSDTMYSLARIAAHKAAPYGFNPAYSSWFGSQLIGHRDVGQTSCPGEKLYQRLQEIRNLVNIYYGYYSQFVGFDASYQGQGMAGAPTANPIMWPGTSENAYIDIKNEGLETWRNSGAGMIMLGTDNLRDRRSSVCSNTWLGSNCDRPSTFSHRVETDPESGVTSLVSATEIKTGEVARFAFKVNAPASGGFFREHFNLLSAGRSWFPRNLGIYFDFRVPAPFNNWQYQGQGVYTDESMTTAVSPTSLQPNTRYYFTLRAKNTGNQPWRNDGNTPTRLATSRPGDRRSALCDSTWIYIDCNRPALLSESVVQPGETGTFNFWVKTPQVPLNNTTYREHFNIIIETKQWLNDVGQYWDYQI